ncbi:hypothetical protein C0J52_12688 [Blattella germanica]|nr:hypothetical protein C0J52_12688 [Blattella germanica]
METNLNEKVFVLLATATIEGRLESINPKSNILTLNQVTYYPSGEQHPTLQLHRDEIKSMYVLQYQNIKESKEIQFQNVGVSMYGVDGFLTANEFDMLIQISQRTVFIDSFSSVFLDAIETISHEKEVGVDAKGFHDNGINILSVSTTCCVYQFDILKLGMPAFNQGLQAILQGEVEKVVHDCHLLSYFLKKYYSVVLKNVFDTAVGELIITKHFAGKFSNFVCGLPDCVKVFLGIPPALVSLGVHDQEMWAKEKLSQNMKFSAARAVVFLLPLKMRILAGMMLPLKKGTDIFLRTIKQSSNEEALKYVGMDYLVPTEFMELQTDMNL